MVTVEPGITAPDGSVMVPRNEVRETCDQAKLQKAMYKNRNARGWRKQRMLTSSKKVVPVAPARLWRDFLLGAEAQMHFRSYRVAEFLLRGVNTRLLINKRGLIRDQVDKVLNSFEDRTRPASYQSMRILLMKRLRAL